MSSRTHLIPLVQLQPLVDPSAQCNPFFSMTQKSAFKHWSVCLPACMKVTHIQQDRTVEYGDGWEVCACEMVVSPGIHSFVQSGGISLP